MQRVLMNWRPATPTQLAGRLCITTDHGRTMPTTSGEIVTSEVAEMSIMDDGTLYARTVDDKEYYLQGKNNAAFEAFDGGQIKMKIS